MSTETATTTKTETKEQDPKVSSMLKALGYLDDIGEQSKLAVDREESATTTEEQAQTESTETAATETTQTESGDGTKETEAVATEEKTAETAATEKISTTETTESTDEADAAAETKADEKRVRKVTQTDKKSPSLDEIVGAVKDAVADSKKTTTEAVETKAEDTFRKNLHPAELKALEMAEAAAKLLPDKYKDAADKEVDWIRKHREFVSTYVKEHGKFDQTDEDYIRFVRGNRPTIPQHDREEILLLQAEERATKKAREAMQQEIAQRDRAIAELKFTPVIQKVGEAVKNDVLTVAGEEFAKAFRDTPQAVAKEFPLEAPIVAAEMANAVVLSTEYLALAKGIKTFDDKNIAHTRIIDFIEKQGKLLDTSLDKGKPYQREGKTLISREKYYSLIDSGKNVSEFTTFNDDDIINMISFSAKSIIQNRLKQERDRHDAVSQSNAKRAAQKTNAPSGEQKAVDGEKKTTIKSEVKSTQPPPKGGATISTGTKAPNGQVKTVPAHLKALGYADAVPSRE